MKFLANGDIQANAVFAVDLIPGPPRVINLNIPPQGTYTTNFASVRGGDAIIALTYTEFGAAAPDFVSTNQAGGNTLFAYANSLTSTSADDYALSYLLAANSGPQTVNAFYSGGGQIFAWNWFLEIGGVSAIANLEGRQLSHTAATDNITGNAVVVPVGSRLIAFYEEFGAVQISPGTGATFLKNVDGAASTYVIEYYEGTGASITPTFTAAATGTGIVGQILVTGKTAVTRPVFTKMYMGNNDVVAANVVLANTGSIKMYANGTLAYGTFKAPTPRFVTQWPSNTDSIVGLNNPLPETSIAFTPITTGDYLLLFTKHQNTTLSANDSLGGIYTALSSEVPLFGDQLMLLANENANTNSQTVTIDSSGGGNIWEGYLLEFEGVSSTSNVFITGMSADATTGVVTGDTVFVPTGSILVARCSSSGVGIGATVSAPGTQIGSNDAKGVVGWWPEGTVTPTFVGNPGTNYTVEQITLTF